MGVLFFASSLHPIESIALKYIVEIALRNNGFLAKDFRGEGTS